jgi:hypothetical protein
VELLISLLWLIGGVAGSAIFYWLAPRWWASKDAQDFNKNPTDDTFHGKFHRQRLTWRVLLALVVAGAGASQWFLWGWLPGVLATVGYWAIGMGYFGYAFNNLLSVARKLDYVKAGYVSPDPRAANPDRWIWAQVLATLGTAVNVPVSPALEGSPTVGQAVAGLLLHLVQLAILWVGILVGGFLIALAAVLALI